MVRLLILIWVAHQFLFLGMTTGLVDFNIFAWKVIDTILMIPIVFILARRTRDLFDITQELHDMIQDIKEPTS